MPRVVWSGDGVTCVWGGCLCVPGGGGGGGDLVPTMPRSVRPKKRTWVTFQLQGSEVSENISLKMGIEFAASLNIGKNLCWVLYIMSYNQHKLYKNNQKMMDCE